MDSATWTRDAIELLTACIGLGSHQESAKYTAERLAELDKLGLVRVIVGYNNLSMLLLFELVKSQGANGEDYNLRALNHLQELSADLAKLD